MTAAASIAAAPPQVAASYARAKAIVERSGTSFALGMRVLSGPRRQAMYAIYAFCREVDDIADAPGEARVKLTALDGWRTEIDRVFADSPTSPIGPALADTVHRFRPPKAEFLAMIDGMTMDAEAPMVAPDWSTLTLYCRRVAGAVGLMSLPVFGARGPDAEAFAETLGRALQLTNILRDVREDAALGRLYLPREALAEAGVPTDDVQAALTHPGLPAACRTVAAEARRAFDRTDRLLAGLDRRVVRPALLMMGIYDRILRRLVAADAWPDGPALSKRDKLWAALRLGLLRPSWRPST